MSVALNPSSSLGFPRPLTELVKRNLTITNDNAKPVAFKVKTTAPKLYCVRPNAGRIEPGESVDVSVQLQPMKEEPPLHVKCKDKFLVQSTYITPDKENRSLAEIWSTTVEEGASQVHQQKIKVAYLPQEGQALEEEEEPVGQPSKQSLVTNDSQVRAINNEFERMKNEYLTFTIQQYETVRQPPSDHNGHAGPIPEFASSIRRTPPPERPFSPNVESYVVAHEEQTRVEESQETRSSPSPQIRQPSPGPIVNVNVHAPPGVRPPSPKVDSSFVSAANVTADISTQDNNLAAKLAEAQEEIRRLRELLESTPDPTELRRRKIVADEGTAVHEDDVASDVGTTFPESMSRQEGASPQQVGVIALLVFIITYLFF